MTARPTRNPKSTRYPNLPYVVIAPNFRKTRRADLHSALRFAATLNDERPDPPAVVLAEATDLVYHVAASRGHAELRADEAEANGGIPAYAYAEKINPAAYHLRFPQRGPDRHSCRVVRRSWCDTTRSLNMLTGEITLTTTRAIGHWETRRCGTPLFGTFQEAPGVCRSCNSGWTHEQNRLATREEMTAAGFDPDYAGNYPESIEPHHGKRRPA